MATGMEDFLSNFVVKKMEEVESARRRQDDDDGDPGPSHLKEIPMPSSSRRRRSADDEEDQERVRRRGSPRSVKDASKSPKSKPIKLRRNPQQWQSKPKEADSNILEDKKDSNAEKKMEKEEEKVAERVPSLKNIKDIKISISDEVREVRVIKVEKKAENLPELGKDVSAKVVDDLFKEFLAKKLEEVETDRQNESPEAGTSNGDSKITKKKHSSRKYRSHSDHDDGKSENIEEEKNGTEKKSRKREKERKSDETDPEHKRYRSDKDRSSRRSKDKERSSKRGHTRRDSGDSEKEKSSKSGEKDRSSHRSQRRRSSERDGSGKKEKHAKERLSAGNKRSAPSAEKEIKGHREESKNSGERQQTSDQSGTGSREKRYKESSKKEEHVQSVNRSQKNASTESESRHKEKGSSENRIEDMSKGDKETPDERLKVKSVSEGNSEKTQTVKEVKEKGSENLDLHNKDTDIKRKCAAIVDDKNPSLKKLSKNDRNGSSVEKSVVKKVSDDDVPVQKSSSVVKERLPHVKTIDIALPDDPKIEKTVVIGNQPPSEGIAPSTNKKTSKLEENPFDTVKLDKSAVSTKGIKLQLGLKISTTSAALISSGIKIENDPKKAALEEGECTNTEEEEESSSDEDDDDEDDEEDGEIESDEEDDDNVSKSSSGKGSKSDKKKKKSKKHKHKHKKKKKKKSKEKENSKRAHSHTSRSKSPKKHKHSKSRSRSRSKSFDKKTGVWRSRSNSPHPRHPERDSSRAHERKAMRDDYRFRDPFHRGRSPERDRHRRPERSRSRERSLRIDKTRLREIAIANAYANMQSGSGPKINLKPDELAALKAGGKSVEELTDFCKKISEKEADDSSDSDEKPFNSEDETDTPFIHHPFKLRDPNPNIVMNIRNAKQLPVMTPGEKAAASSTLRLQYPVSSGSHHRLHENVWVPVEKKTTAPPTTTTNTSTNSSSSSTTNAASSALVTTAATAAVAIAASASSTTTKTENRIFPDPPAQPIDIGSIVSERLKAVRKLQDNPHDVQAMGLMYKAQQKMNEWAASKQLPGHFTGSTGVTVLSQQELADKHHQAWAKKDTFHKAAPISGGIGRFLLQKMGWKEGEGLGKNNEGNLEPLALDVKIDRKGLTSADEKVKKTPAVPMMKDLSGKHPVSALVELCNKRRWGSPDFIIVNETGPDHKKNFLFKVKINGVEYQPTSASSNKKNAKAGAATVCLQALGLVPRDQPQ